MTPPDQAQKHPALTEMRKILDRWDAAKGKGGYPTAMERYSMREVLALAEEAGRLREALTEIKRVAERIYHLEETGTVAALRIVEIVKTTEALSTPSEAPNAD